MCVTIYIYIYIYKQLEREYVLDNFIFKRDFRAYLFANSLMF